MSLIIMARGRLRRDSPDCLLLKQTPNLSLKSSRMLLVLHEAELGVQEWEALLHGQDL